MASDGRIVEIHVLSTPEFHPKQVVRNVESALSAALRIDVDRRIISVSQLEEDMPPARADGGAGDGLEATRGRQRGEIRPGAPTGDTDPDSSVVIPIRRDTSFLHAQPERVRFAGIRTHTHSSRSVACEVLLTLDGQEFVGREEAPDTESGRLSAAARATFLALEAALGQAPAVLEGVSAVDADAGRYVLVLARGFSGRDRVQLVGTARLRGAAEDAAVMATLQALDRWLTADAAAG